MHYGCIGAHLPHSFSKLIHEAIGGYDYQLKELSESELAPFLTARDFRGINVTIPYKEAVIPYLSELSPCARAIGAVNTIVNRDGRLFGDNTDFSGMRALIQRLGIDLTDAHVLVLGTGGTSKTAMAVASSLGASRVTRVSRSGRDGAITYDDAYAAADTVDVIINTTPSGMYPDVFASPIDLAPFSRLSGVIDAVYNPLSTTLVLEAKKRNIPASGGLYMLVSQAVAASEVFFDRTYEPTLTDRIYQDLYREKRNVVLIGMPSSGKTTVGRILAEKSGRPLVDTDEEIEKTTGKTPAALIRDDGIDAFRDIESAVIRSLAPTSGIVLATGGGAILRQENVDALKRNGALWFLDRPLSALITTDDRPLSDSKDKLTALYNERLPLYRAAADVTVPGDGSPEDVAERIEKSEL